MTASEYERRLRSLRELHILDTQEEERFDRIIGILCRLLQAPIGFLGLVDAHRVWYKSHIGLPQREVPLHDSFCARVVAQEGAMIINDTQDTPAYQILSWVSGAPHVRAYIACPLLGPGGERIGTLGVMDVKPRRFGAQEEKLLRDLLVWATRELNFPVLQQARTKHMDSEVRMRAVLNNVQEGILTLKLSGEVVSINPAAERIFDFSTKELVGQNILTLLELESAGRKLEARASGLISTPSLHSLIDGEVTGRRKDGSTFPLELSLSEMYIGNQKMFTAIVRDITERKFSQMQLQESEERYRDLFENANDLIHIAHMDGRFLYVNRAWRETLGYEEEEVSGLRLSRIVHHEERERFLQYLERVQAGENLDQVESTFVTRQGRLIHVEGSITGKEEEGEIVSTRSIFHDVTERRKIEQMKKEFISVVSHELRTPLTSICGSLGLLNGGVVGDLSQQAQSMISIAYNNSQRLVRLINDILDIEKIENGKMEFEMERLALMPLIAQSLEANDGYAKAHHIRFRITHSAEDAWVEADSGRLMQVMNNLLSNAAKFSPAGEEVSVAVTTYGEYFRVSVIDSGPGIPDSFRARIFAKFAQADASTTRHKGGTGLGLSICKQLIEQMNGRIDFQSQVGAGSTFFFDLPQMPPPLA